MKSGIIQKSKLLLFILLLHVSLVSSQTVPDTGQKKFGNRKVRVGYFSFQGFNEVDSDGERRGYGYEYLQYLAKYNNWVYEYIGYGKSWAEMEAMLERGEIDLLASAQKTPEREKCFAFSRQPMGSNATIVNALGTNHIYEPYAFSHFNGIRIGMITGSSRNAELAACAQKNCFTYIPVMFSGRNGASDIEKALANGTIDAIVTSNMRSTSGEKTLIRLDPVPFYFMTRKDDVSLLNQLNEANERLLFEYPNVQGELFEKYYGVRRTRAFTLSNDEHSYVQSLLVGRTSLKTLLYPDMYPFSSFKNGRQRGVVADVAGEIARKSGLPMIPFPVSDSAWYNLAVQSRAADIILDFPVSAYNAETCGYKLTQPYLNAGLSLIYMHRSALNTPVVATIRMLQSGAVYVVQEYGATSVICYDSYAKCIEAMRRGDADAVLMDSFSAQNSINTNTRGKLHITDLHKTISFSIAVRDDENPALISIIQKALFDVDSSYFETVILRNSKPDGTANLFYFLWDNYRELMLSIIFFLGTGISIQIVVMVLKSRNEQLLAQKNAELERADKAKSLFLSNMSHDLRTPMNTILGITELTLNNGIKDEKLHDDILRIKTSGRYLMDIINAVLDMSKIESGKMSVTCSPVNVSEFLQSVKQITENYSKTEKLHYITDFPESRFPFVMMDRQHVQQILVNLLSNAVKFTPEGGKVMFACGIRETEDGRVEHTYTISDTGPGMSPEFLKKLYQPFEQEETGSENEGTGLGLSIAKRLVDLMSGTITCTSIVDAGTTFTVKLKYDVVLTPGTPKKTAHVLRTEEKEKKMLYGKHILVAEDHPINAQILVELLKTRGISADIAENGERAVELFNTSPEKGYDAILMDIRMPVMNGLEAARAIRDLKRSDALQIPIIAMTANAFDDDIKKALDAGMNAHLAKPIDVDKLFAALGSFC